jgi:PQQ-dependent catabolism-associated CXXCW motif protein
MTRMLRIAFGLLTFAAATSSFSFVFLQTTEARAGAQSAKVEEPDGYRLDDYKSPVPATLKGATVIDTARAFELWSQKGAIFVDALARFPKPANLPPKTVWRDPQRFDIPGSIWLANTGYGALAPETEKYFEGGLARATASDKERSLVFYCLSNCWMSWNAARRALALGYAHVLWYPQGTDGWEKAGHPLERREPAPAE